MILGSINIGRNVSFSFVSETFYKLCKPIILQLQMYFIALEYEIPTFETIESFGSHIDAFHKLEDAEN